MLSVVEPNEQNLYLLLFIVNVTIKVENTLSCVAGESCDFLETDAEKVCMHLWAVRSQLPQYMVEDYGGSVIGMNVIMDKFEFQEL